MKSDYVVLSAAAAYVAFLGFAAGTISAAPVTASMPHGPLEYFLERYQSAWVGGGALIGLAIAGAQLRHSRLQHRTTLQLSTEAERRALREVVEFSEFVIASSPKKPLNQWQVSDLPGAVGHYWDTRQFPLLERELDPELLVIFHKISDRAKEYSEMRKEMFQKVKTHDDKVLLARYKMVISNAERAVDRAKHRLGELQALVNPDTPRHS